MAEHNIVGREGEQAAIAFLRGKGYSILSVNWKYRKLEIDIVAQYNNQLIVAEVKTRGEGGLLDPEMAVTKAKQKNLIRAANAYVTEKDIHLETRFDILSVYKTENAWHVKHIEDAFYALL